MIYGIILGIHVLVCILLVLVVLMQSSKGGGLAGGAFGGGAESTVFGGRGAATVLSKATTVFGMTFMVTSLTLTLLSASRTGRSVRSVVAEDAASAGLPVPTQTAPPTGTAMPGAETTMPAGPEAGPVLPVNPTPAQGSESTPGTDAPAEETTPAPSGE
ncbi:MAG: preprotein translocase subunit SecG [bacterium]